MKQNNIELESYCAPECRVVKVETEGILCASGSTIDNYNELDYEW